MKMKLHRRSVSFSRASPLRRRLAQAPKPERLAGVIGKVDGHTVTGEVRQG